jgi:hypothetical protein
MARLFPSPCTRRGFFESTAELFGTLALSRVMDTHGPSKAACPNAGWGAQKLMCL